MSTSELRRGPGWWMDLDGQWNPPEVWPEATPPLPGWTRSASGTWTPPRAFKQSPAVTSATTEPELGSATIRRVPSLDSLDETATIPAVPEPDGLGLSYSEMTAVPDEVDQERLLRRAIAAMVISALTASMIAAGLILLLMLL